MFDFDFLANLRRPAGGGNQAVDDPRAGSRFVELKQVRRSGAG